MPFGAQALVVTEQEREELQQMTQARTLPAGDVMRSRMILLLADASLIRKFRICSTPPRRPFHVGSVDSCSIGSPV
jgi:hypothetical protein